MQYKNQGKYKSMHYSQIIIILFNYIKYILEYKCILVHNIIVENTHWKLGKFFDN